MTLLSRPSLRLSLRLSLALAVSTIVVACSAGPGTSTGGKINAVAGENFYGDLVSRVGGDLVSVTSILSDPNVDPHTYESSPQNAQQVAALKQGVLNELMWIEAVQTQIPFPEL